MVFKNALDIGPTRPIILTQPDLKFEHPNSYAYLSSVLLKRH